MKKLPAIFFQLNAHYFFLIKIFILEVSIVVNDYYDCSASKVWVIYKISTTTTNCKCNLSLRLILYPWLQYLEKEVQHFSFLMDKYIPSEIKPLDTSLWTAVKKIKSHLFPFRHDWDILSAWYSTTAGH